MENKNEELAVERLARELRMTRIFCIISSALTICLLIGGFLMWNNIQPVFSVVQEAKPIMEQLSALDVEELNHTLEQVNVTLESVDWQQVSESLKELDVDAINEAVAGLDTEELTKAIENLNKTAEAMESFAEKFKSLTGLFN